METRRLLTAVPVTISLEANSSEVIPHLPIQLTGRFADDDGVDDLGLAEFRISADYSDQPRCHVVYDSVNEELRLGNEVEEGAVAAGKPGQGKTVTNAYCSLDAGASSVSALDAKTLEVTIDVAFSSSMVGDQNVWLRTSDRSGASSLADDRADISVIAELNELGSEPWVAGLRRDDGLPVSAQIENLADNRRSVPDSVPLRLKQGVAVPASAALPIPAAPSGLVAIPSGDRVVLEWSADNQESIGYVVYRSKTAGGPYQQMNVDGPTQTKRFIDDLAVVGTTYHYVVKAINSAGSGSLNSNEASATLLDTTPPATPTGIVVTARDGSVELTWEQNSEADFLGYRIDRSTGDEGYIRQTEQLSQSHYRDDYVVNGTTYVYSIMAVDTSGNASGFVHDIKATPTDSTPPQTPSRLVATAREGLVELDWDDNPEVDLAGYELYRAAGSGGFEKIETPRWISESRYTDDAVVNGTTYRYYAKAIDLSGNASDASTQATALPLDSSPPARPIGLKATAGDGRVELTWTGNTESDLDGYLVYRSLDDGSFHTLIVSEAISENRYVDLDIANGNAYSYVIRAVDLAGNLSVQSSRATALPVDATPPARPIGLKAAAGDGRVELTWTGNTEGDLDGYLVYRSLDDGSFHTLIVSEAINENRYVDHDIANGNAYSYVIRAMDLAGNLSVQSSRATASPVDASPPAKPSGLKAVPGNGRVTLTWGGNAEADLNGYRIYRSSTADGPFKPWASAVEAKHVDTRVDNASTYFYLVKAVDDAGNESSASAWVSATPQSPLTTYSATAECSVLVAPRIVENPTPNHNALYVSKSGKGTDGLSEATAFKTISEALAIAQPGQTIYVKAGNYGNEELTFPRSGKRGKPIQLEGYRQTPGDNPTIADFSATHELDPIQMPMLDGGNRAAGIALNLQHRSHLVIKNFQITNYRTGIYGNQTTDSLIQNVIATEFGDIAAKYDGKAISLYESSHGNVIRNSVVVNAAAEAIFVRGDHNLIENNLVLADDNQTGAKSSTDYYVVLFDASHNIVKGNEIERIGELGHIGHGYTVKSSGTCNVFDDNIARNVAGGAFVARHRAVQHNRWLNSVAHGTKQGILIRDGASYNHFENIKIHDPEYGIAFTDTGEDGGMQSGGNHNTFKRVEIYNSGFVAIGYREAISSRIESVGNRFEGLIIDTARYLFDVRHVAVDNSLSTSSIRNVEHYAYYEDGAGPEDLGIVIDTLTTKANTGF